MRGRRQGREDRARSAHALAPYQAKYPAPFAVLAIRTAGGQLTRIDYLPPEAAPLDPLDPLAARVCRQIERYLGDSQFRFDLPFVFQGSDFQRRVWREILRIPAGRTRSYLDIARRLDTAPRPVGGACGANRIPLVIPCHRVVASNGIGGFMHARGGQPLAIKRWLITHEAA
ncbi:MAG: methylated-DNA--[protein]-cysteine S-methyltransferase [Betaproteobacteria bacterium]|nr:methylated-DNA--[protein]-cysteine S-methyltransferase [Betaproteobacteria bacterium]